MEGGEPKDYEIVFIISPHGRPKNVEFKCNLNCLFSKALRVFILIARLIILCCAHTYGNSIKGSFILGWREGDIPYRFDFITFRISTSKLGMLYFQSSTPITRNRPSKANSLMCSTYFDSSASKDETCGQENNPVHLYTNVIKRGPKEIRELYFNTHRQNVIAIVISIFQPLTA